MAEGLAIKVPVEAHHDDVSVKVLDLALGKQDEVVEELGFVDDDSLDIARNVVWDLHKSRVGGVTCDAYAIMCDHFGSGGVANVGAGLDDEDVRPDAASPSDGRVDEAGLSGKHRAHNDFEAHSVLYYASSGILRRGIRFSEKFVK